ncbi:MAG: tryptophan synthase subunit beta [Spirochaetia bacterium]
MSVDFFGPYGGKYVAEMLRGALDELSGVFDAAADDPSFWKEYSKHAKEYVGRPTPLYYAENTSRTAGGADIYIKLEGLANTGAHKINNALGQVLLARRMGKTRIIAETGAGQHGYATAAVCAKFGMPCRIYMGEVDIRRQRPNVFWMEMFGAEVVPVKSGSRTLKDAVNEALRDWAANHGTTHYLLGSALGPAPYPRMVHRFQSIVGTETEAQLASMGVTPDAMIACVGGGSNAVGFFSPYLDKQTPRLIGAEAGGRGEGTGEHAARMNGTGVVGIAQGYKSLFLLDSDGQIGSTHSISAGLDYPGIGPELAYYGEAGRIEFTGVRDQAALDALRVFAENEGIVFALESAHAGAASLRYAKEMGKGKSIVINMSGRGDKDIFITAGSLEPGTWKEYLQSEADRI